MKKIYNYFINKKNFSLKNEIKINIHKNYYKLSYLKKRKFSERVVKINLELKRLKTKKRV